MTAARTMQVVTAVGHRGSQPTARC